MERNQKAFASITILLFLLFFLFITFENKTYASDFLIIKQVETKKESTYLNFEKIIENKINNCKDNPSIIKEEIVLEILKFKPENTNFFIKNKINLEKKELNYINLNDIIKVIVYKPSKNIIVKDVYITNGILKNKNLGFIVNTKKYNSIFLFPENYFIRKVVFC